MQFPGLSPMQTPAFSPTTMSDQGMAILRAALAQKPPAAMQQQGAAPGGVSPAAMGANAPQVPPAETGNPQQPGGLLGGMLPQGGLLNSLFAMMKGGHGGSPGSPLSLAPPMDPVAPSPTALTGLW